MRRTCMHRELSEILVTLVESMALAISRENGQGEEEGRRKRGFARSIISVIVSTVSIALIVAKYGECAMRTDISQLRTILSAKISDSTLSVTCNSDSELSHLRF